MSGVREMAKATLKKLAVFFFQYAKKEAGSGDWERGY